VSPLNRFDIERGNLRHAVDHPEDLVSMALSPSDFSVPEFRQAYREILKAAQAGRPIPDSVLALLAAQTGE
jgi:replicative DNA helicase